jgi:hypothetical protein
MQKYEFKTLAVLFSSKDYRAKFLFLMKCFIIKIDSLHDYKDSGSLMRKGCI